MIILQVAVLGNCSVAPSNSVVERAIRDYFENGQYRVIDLKIGKIEGMPLSEKTYMGTPGYVVEVIAIIIEAKTNKGADIKKGDQLTFSNAKIGVREDTTNNNIWHVSIISGISVP